MTDPLEPLRDVGRDPSSPPPDAIRDRAKRIAARRRAAVGGVATVVLIAGVAGIVLSGGSPEPARDVTDRLGAQGAATASPSRTTAPPAETEFPAAGEATSGGTGGGGGSPGTTDSAAASRPKTEGGSQRSMAVEVEVVSDNGSHDFTVEACNPHEEAVEAWFEDSQRYDVEVFRGDDLVWRWSHDQFFLQATGSETWDAGACRTWTETWSGKDNDGQRVDPGRYEAVGWLTSSPAFSSDPEPVCHIACLDEPGAG